MNMQQPQNMATWHAMYSFQDRQKVIQILASTLKEIQGANYNVQKAQNMALEFEKFTFMKAPTRDEYLRAIKQKITQLRGNIRPMMDQQQQQQQQPQQPQQQQNSMNMNFLQQQAQARQQSAAQIQAQMRLQSVSSAPNPAPTSGPAPANGNNTQVQQIIGNMIKNVPIPATLLAKIPNLPPNINTWTQIFDCFQKKIIPHSAMPIIREIHNTHMQLALRQHQQQRLNQMNKQPQQPAQNSQIPANPQLARNANFNLNNMSAQQKGMLQRQQQQQNPQSQFNQLKLKQAAQAVQAAPLQHQAVGQQPAGRVPNQTITPDDIVKYSADALALLNTLQNNGSIPRELDQAQKQSFIRKFIHHQKLTLWKQRQGQGQQQGQPAQQRPAQPQAQGLGNFPDQLNPQMMNASPMIPQQVPPSQPQLQQQQQQQQQRQFNMTPQLGNNQLNGTPAASAQAAGGAGARPANNSMSAIIPPLTDEMKAKLRKMFEEVSRNNVALKDVTQLLSQQEKTQVGEILAKISQQYVNVDSILSYFYVLTKNLEGTKRLIQMKHMTRQIVDNLRRGVYLAGPDLLEKLRSQYQKYFDYVKEQVAIRRQAQQRQLTVQAQRQPQRPQQFNGPAASPQLNQVNNWSKPQPVPMNYQAPPVQMPQGMGNKGSPLLPGASPVPSAKQPAKPPAKKPVPVPNNNRRKLSANKIPTPAENATTPATLANAIKTPNSIPTPHVPQTHSNKNTPQDMSPSYPGRGATATPFNREAAVIDIFSNSGADSKATRRRELSNTDPEKFFLSSLANLLDLEETSAELLTPAPSEKSNIDKSPLSPLSNEWTCAIRPDAITSAFKQVDAIREVVANDIIEVFTHTEPLKRDNTEMDDHDDIDGLFDEKKFKPDVSDFSKHMFEPIGVEDWRTFVASTLES